MGRYLRIVHPGSIGYLAFVEVTGSGIRRMDIVEPQRAIRLYKAFVPPTNPPTNA